MSRKVLAKFFNFLKIKKKTIEKNKQSNKYTLVRAKRYECSNTTGNEKCDVGIKEEVTRDNDGGKGKERKREKKRREQVSERRLHCRRGKENSTKFK